MTAGNGTLKNFRISSIQGVKLVLEKFSSMSGVCGKIFGVTSVQENMRNKNFWVLHIKKK
jgi:hypothetical protein